MLISVIIALIFSLLVYAASPAHAVIAFVEAYVDGTGGVNGLAMAQDVVVSPDGKHVYAVSEGDDAVIRFDRDDAATGKLSFVRALTDGVAGVNGIAAVHRPRRVAGGCRRLRGERRERRGRRRLRAQHHERRAGLHRGAVNGQVRCPG